MSVRDFKSIRKAFTGLADTLSGDFDLLAFLDLLCGYCADLLPACAAGVLIAATHGTPPLVSGSAELTRRLMTAELRGQAGPATDALHGGRPVGCPDLSAVKDGWPALVAEARRAGYHAVDALPMRLRDQTIGALTLYRAARGPLDSEAAELAMAIADVATIGILHQRALHREELVCQQLQTALDSRIIIEQAKGVLAERLEVAIDEAFRALRCYARDNNMKLTDAARAIAEGTLDIDPLLPWGRHHTGRPHGARGRRVR
jgi:transcriptional regulator with GAF, ATPase, and Fis domain